MPVELLPASGSHGSELLSTGRTGRTSGVRKQLRPLETRASGGICQAQGLGEGLPTPSPGSAACRVGSGRTLSSAGWGSHLRTFPRPQEPEDTCHPLEWSSACCPWGGLGRDSVGRQCPRCERRRIPALRRRSPWLLTEAEEAKCCCWMWVRMSEPLSAESHAGRKGSGSLREICVRHALCMGRWPDSVRSSPWGRTGFCSELIHKCGVIWELPVNR